MIEYYESATHLNISFNKHIGTRGWQAAAHMMRKTNCLQYLDARGTPPPRPLGAVCGAGAAHQQQFGGAAPGERQPVGAAPHAAG
ncbi:protein phosphatase 1 regulatory subunit 37-like [Meleagris gallopavo]|uniref:protein phosphatase 1 regulatory subunit 37-like n=1 Tax=Meleagris gallopavo TaxID=9103 RepID=UPI000549DA1A|nr:protein phosphatase 1 regulatory subunit 37-like [Meleagris gallopavo]